ncbi:uncharacterized protein BXIN_2432 [Babesia sp. Xinjiang]|uniref:uncharacterized protein n=1 Tax=Babesia sp. Xinjiang TaxID=462227 RepID=UPI000A24D306|nr:uncharacterized protein BXIN_2432 [Babesia sp. Xinjiang]ORM41036.1 hypothetical protein BXIN_2432 [Babesia sp. Xinjiang]
MGFQPEMFTQTERTGHYIKEILDYFTRHDINSVSLYNTIRCLICTGLRTPRTVGDLFGFFLYLGEKMNNGGSSPSVADAIQNESANIPWNYKGSSSITDAVKALVGEKHTEKSHNSEPDLYTLYNSKCDKKNNGYTCGKYLQSLSYSIYRNISTTFAKSYLSRIVYLTDVLKEGLEKLLEDFKKITCEGCTHCNGTAGNCHSNNNCQCDNVVQCAGVLGVLYKFGFTYTSASGLNGKSNPSYKRTCSQFSQQLDKVINGDPFKQLLSAINKFLYHIRKPFFLYLLTFWLLAIIYLTYSLTIPLDVLHLRSHLRTAVLTPLVLLTNYT